MKFIKKYCETQRAAERFLEFLCAKYNRVRCTFAPTSKESGYYHFVVS
jgi:hypothetical protein